MAIAGILLAAGASSRMGWNKLLLELDGEPLVRRAARRALEAGLSPLLVVVGHEPERVREALAGLPCQLVENPAWAAGQGSSVAAGAAAVPPGAEAAVVLLSDMPAVTADMIRAVAARWRATGAPIVTSRYGAVTAPPALYAAAVLPELCTGPAEGRGRAVIGRHGDAVLPVDWPAAALVDLDRPGDLARAAGVPAAGAGGRDEEIFDRAAAWIAAGEPVAMATVVSTWGSSLRPAGSQLAVSRGGALAGSVSGGCVESAVAAEALAAIADRRVRRLSFGVSDAEAWAVGLPCGGRIELVVNPVDAPLLADLRADLAARRPVVLALDLATGREWLLHPPAEGGPLAAAADEALRSDRATRVQDGGGEVLLRPYQVPPRLVLVGAVHIAQALARMAAACGLDVVVVDPRRAFATPERFPGVPLVAGWPAEALAGIGLHRRDALVTLAHDPKIDDPALVAALRAGCFHVGALGSRRSHAARLERLRREGVGEAGLSRIEGPVGLDIGAVTPGEIAASILASVVAALRTGGREGT